jgi:hypothetical protein
MRIRFLRLRALQLSLCLCCLSSATNAIAQTAQGGVAPGRSYSAPSSSTLLTSATPSTCTAADLVDTQLWSFNLPANTLNEDGKAIRVSASFALGVNANSKTVNFRVGGTTIGSRVTTQSGGATATVGTIIRTGAATETAYGDNSVGTGGTIVSLTSDTTTRESSSARGARTAPRSRATSA